LLMFTGVAFSKKVLLLNIIGLFIELGAAMESPRARGICAARGILAEHELDASTHVSVRHSSVLSVSQIPK
jgi:hypothetical protein